MSLMARKPSPAKLHARMTVQQFDNGYWYATAIKDFAKDLGITGVSGLRKDEIEDLIRHYLGTGRIRKSGRKATRNRGERDSAQRLTVTRPVVNYTNDQVTKDFLEREREKLVPGQRQKSGAKYRLNRWREQEISAGHGITYGDLVRKYAELCDVAGRFPQARSGRYINFLSDFLRREKSSSRKDAIAAWHELKDIDVPKTYAAWRKWMR